MTVHAVKVETSRISRGTPPSTVVRTLLAGLSEATDAESMEFKEIEPTDTEALDEGYYAGLFRFDEDEHSPDELLDTFENVLRGPAKWYRIRYHLCDHNEEPGTRDEPFECDINARVRLGGEVPSALAGPTDPDAV